MHGAGCSLSFVGSAAGCSWFFMGGVSGHLSFFVGGGAGPLSPFMAGGAGPSFAIRGAGTHCFSWVEVPSFEGGGGGSSFMCAGAHCHSLALVFCAVHLSLSFAICRHLLSICHRRLFVVHCFTLVSSAVVSCHDVVAGLPIREG